ncbi:hypothetical protein [Billgrantia ethanolica]|uniref:Uncharacterized protein n=1 Tax=Billgrantia ethanolica TaxID=2733486 RepID=A0ABS9A1E2_9GAMM|nr:hypothetical protein [Halomonas ethanolica]MCE8001644.1 hypothetical protein [Halomonas ethanolica]
MQKGEIPYWGQLNDAISLSLFLGLEKNNKFDFEGVGEESWYKTHGKIIGLYNHIIEMRDRHNIPRTHTVFDCGGMTVTLHNLLGSQGIKSLVVVGDVHYKGQAFYNSSISEMLLEIDPFTRKKSVNSHTWLMLSNFMVVDMTMRIKKDLNDVFVNGLSIGEPLIFDVENPPMNFIYRPMLVGKKYLEIINS